VAVAGVLVAGAAVALVVRSAASGSSPTATSTSTRKTTGSISLASGDDVIRGLPAPRAAGRILVATVDCRLEVITVATRAIDRPRPDVASCSASLLPAPGLAVAAVGESAKEPSWRRLGRRREDDRPLLPSVPSSWAVGPGGEIATCVTRGAVSTVALFPPSGARRDLPGCSPAWWRGRLVRIDPSGRVVDDRGLTVLDARDTKGTVAGVSALAASRDGSHLALVHGTAPGLDVTVFDAGGEAVATLPVPFIGGRVARVQLSDDGRLVAIQTNAGWTVGRTDGSVPPIDEVAQSIIIDVSIAPDSRAVAIALAHRIVFLDPATLGPVAQLPVEADSVDWGS
jgi:hypothetical protein